MENRAPTEALMDEKTVVTEKVAVEEEDVMVQQRSPITILSEDEGYLLEEDGVTFKDETGVGTYREFFNQEEKTVRPKKKKIKVKDMDFAIVRHQGRTLKMLRACPRLEA